MKKIKICYVIFLVATLLLVQLNFIEATEDEYEDDHGDNVVEHPGPTFPSIEIEVEEKSVPTEGNSSASFDDSLNEESEEVIQTTTYPVFDDEPLSSTTAKGTTLPPTSTTPGATTISTPTTTTIGSTSTQSTTTTTSATTVTTEGISTTTVSAVPFLPPHQRPVRSDLASIPSPKGQEIIVGNLTIYESPVTNKTFDGVMLISVHDIFGFHPHVKYISDRLSEFGLRTVVPDFFHGKPTAVENFPPPNFTDTARYLFDKDRFWKESVKSDLLNTMSYYRSVANVNSFGLYGFCWGAKMIVYATSDTDFKGIDVIGFVHPSRVVTQDANDFTAPAILLPSNAETDLIPFLKILQQKFGEGKSEHYRYDDMRHGFAGATSDFSNPDIRKRVEDVIEKLGSYFRKHLV